MTLPAKQPQHPPARGAAPEYHQYAWPLRADRACQTHGSHGRLPSPDECSMNSWEARAFAEDTSSLAAGIWPPRAYPCSFCHREFRSAQALGGHMNVHRRDRARMRLSSPPAPPFCTPQNISLHPAATIIHKFQHGYSFSTGDVNPSAAACPHIYPNEILSKVNVLPTALPLPAISPKSSTASLAARYPSHMAASFPLRLHLLASEAASTLMLPEAEAMNQLSLWPASAIDSGNGCRSSTAIDAHIKLGSAANNSSWSVPSSLPTRSSSLLVLKAGTPHVTPSMEAIPCKRARHIDVPSLIQLENESPRKKCSVANNSDYPPYMNQDISLKSCSKDDGIIIQAEPQKHETSNKSGTHVDESMCMMQREWVAACGGECVDLELRLGQRPPYPPADYHQTTATAPVWSQLQV